MVGEWEKLDGSEDVRVTAQTEVRLVAVDRAAYEAALTGSAERSALVPAAALAAGGEHERQDGEHEAGAR